MFGDQLFMHDQTQVKLECAHRFSGGEMKCLNCGEHFSNGQTHAITVSNQVEFTDGFEIVTSI